MRIKGVIFILVLVAIGFAISFFITDEVIEEKIEYQASVINKAKVEIDGFEFELFGLKLAWDRLQVANPNNTMKNTFETGETEFDMKFWPLMWEKVVIDDVRLTEFRLDTERETDGYFEMPPQDEEPGFISQAVRDISNEVAGNISMEFMDIKDDINVDSLLAIANIQSVDRIDSLKNALQQTYSEWDSTITNNSIRRNVNDIRREVDSLNVDKLNKPEQIVTAIVQVQKIAKEADSVKREIENLKNNFERDLSNTRRGVSSVDDWVRADINRAAGLAKLPELNTQSIAKALFGPTLISDLNTYMQYSAIAREYGMKIIGVDEEEPKPERYEGRNYEFSDKYDWPGFWIRNVELSGYTNNEIALSGQVTDISNDQQRAGEPMIISLSGENTDQIRLDVNAEFNYLEENPRESFEVQYAGFPLANSKISPSELLPYELSSGKGTLSLNLDIIGRRIDSRLGYEASQVEFDFSSAGEPKGRIDSFIRTAISGTDQITAAVLVDNIDGPLRVRVRSNIDDLLLNTLRQTVSQEVENARRRIRAEVEERVDEKREEVEALIEQKEAELRAEYDRFESRIEEQLNVIEEKRQELEKKKEELRDSALDALRDRIDFDF